MRKRAFAWLLSFAMLLSFIPNAALANEPDSQNSILEIEQREAENVSDAQDAQAKVAETAVAQDERRSAEAETLPSTRDEPKYETPDATQSVIPEEDNDNAVTDVLEQNADAHLAEDALVQGLTPAFSDVQRGMLLGESVEIIASGECGANGDNVIWTLDADGALTISGTGAMADYAQNTVPWYEKRLQVKQVMIQSSVTTIGNWAFGLCTSLTSVTIPDSVTTIGGSAFSDCTALTSVTIPDSVTNIGDAAFNDCAALTSVTIPDSVTNIAEYAFAGCDALTSMTIPNSVTNIGDAAFGDCDALANIQVSAGNNSFSDMDGVLFNKDYTILILYPSGKDRAAYVIPDSVTIIRDGAFYGCAALTSVTIPDSVTSIRDRAFYGCAALTSVTIPDGVTTIRDRAFYGCAALTSVTIPDSVTSIRHSAFSSCAALTSVTIPDSVTSIENFAFYGCAALTSVTIPNSVTTIGIYAFSDCTALTSVTIPDSVTSIEPEAFYGCESLTSVTIPDSVTSIGSYAFFHCAALTDVYYTGSEAQWNAITVGINNDPLTSAAIHYNWGQSEIIASGECGANGDNVTWTLDADGVLTISGTGAMADYTDKDAPWKAQISQIKTLIIQSGVSDIGNSAFYNCPALTGVTIPDSVTSIGNGAFCGCAALISVSIPDSVTSIGWNAFYNCSKLTSVTIPNSVTSIGARAFYNCSALRSVTIPNKLTSIELGVFYGCNALTSVVIPGNVRVIGKQAFYRCGNLKSVTISTGVTTIGESAFGSCKNLVSATIPDGVTAISGWAFSDTALTSVTIPDSVTAIGYEAFKYCGSLTKIVIPNSVTSIGDYAFASCGNVTIYGGAGSTAETYASANNVPFVAYQISDVSPAASSTIGGASYVVKVTMNTELPLSVTAEKDGVSAQVPATDSVTNSNGSVLHTLTLDLSALESSLYQFRFFNETYGVERSVSYDVDCSAPSTPENFRVMAGNLKNTLAWDAAKEADVTSIRIYRTTDETAEPQLLTALSGRTAVTYADNGLEEDVTYYYWLSFADKFSQESEKAGPVAGTPTSDSEPPSITTVYPADGTTLTGSVSFRVTASDNQRVKSVAMEISTEVGESASWETLETVDTTGQAEFTLDSTRYNVDALYVRFLAEDTSGNTAYSKLTYTFPVDNTPPETVSSITGEASATSITLHWTYDAPSDFSHFTLEKRDGSGAYAKVGGNLTSLGAQINNLTPGTEYSFRVMAFDIHGNHSEYSEEYSFTTSADTDAPVITAMSPQPGRYNGSIPLLFTATDNDSIQSMTYQTSNDGLEWTDMTTITVASANKTAAVSYSLNTASFEEGVLYVRAVAADASGNVSDTSNNAPYTQYMVDRTAPAAPRALEGVSVSGTVYLTWLQGTEQDLNGYTVERAYEENGSYSALATAWKKLSYTDSGVAAGQTYYYRLRSQDTAGNASAYSEVVAVTVETVPDTEAPRIVSVSPSDGYTLGADTPIRVSVSDNRLVASLSVQYSADGENWSALDEIQVSAKNSVVTIPLTASDIGGDALFLRVSCIDGAELTSGTVNRAYSIDTTPPAAPVVTAEAAAMSVVLNWTSGNESDLAGFYLYRKAGGESGYSYLAQCGKNTTSYKDTKVIAERNYSYYVSAIDARSNQSSSLPTEAVKPLNIDVEPPVIRASGDTVGTVGIEMQFSAKNTTDNFGASGLSYAWNFGDGETSSLLEPRHTYQSAGSYTISLTVTDAAGNSSSGQIAVTIKEATEAAWLDVTVKDDSGNPVSGAGVYFDLGEEEQETVYTNNSGVARVTAKEGTFTVGVYKNGYLPEKAENVTLIKGAVASVAVQLVKKNIVTGKLTVEPMTLEEIKAAGIDTTDPANFQVFQYEIELTYSSEPVRINANVNGNGKVLIDPQPLTIPDGQRTRKIQTFIIENTTTEGTVINGSRDTNNLPIVAILDLPGETTWLKDFFDVHLYVLNQAGGEYVLDDCIATLNVPDGLTLMDSNRTSTSPIVEMGSITGQNSATAEWILRGDKKGDYTLSADFTATLRDFNEAIQATFTTEDPIHVREGEGMVIEVIAEGAISAYNSSELMIGLRNESEWDYNLPSLSIQKAELLSTFKTKGLMNIATSEDVLHPGEILWYDYRIAREDFPELLEHGDSVFYLRNQLSKVFSPSMVEIRFNNGIGGFVTGEQDKTTKKNRQTEQTTMDYPFTYSDGYFYKPPTPYNHKLATMSLSLAIAAMDDSWANDLLSRIHFSNIESYGYDIPTSMHTIAATFSQKFIGEDVILSIAVRGGKYHSEWGGNFEIGENELHHINFQEASENVLRYLQDYLTKYPLHNNGNFRNVKIWITGFSRGAATANLVSAKLLNSDRLGNSFVFSDYLPENYKENIYAYTFETPRNTTDLSAKSKTYDCIFNIVNPADLVPKVAPTNWGFLRYGNDVILPSAEYEVNFLEWQDGLRKQYKVITGYDYEYDLTIDSGNQKGNLTPGRLQDAMVETLFNLMISRQYYAQEYQDTVTKVIEALKSENEDTHNAMIRDLLVFEIDRIVTKVDPVITLTIPEYRHLKPKLKEALSNYKAFSNFTDEEMDVVTELVSKILTSGDMLQILLGNITEDLFSAQRLKNTVIQSLKSSAKGTLTGAAKGAAKGFVLGSPGGPAGSGAGAATGAVAGAVTGAVTGAATGAFKGYILDEAAENAINFANTLNNHEPVVCMAWLISLSDNQDWQQWAMRGDDPSVIFWGTLTREVLVNGWVRALVYDKDGTLVAAINDDKVDAIDGSSISASVGWNGQKTIYLPANMEYEIRFAATDDTPFSYTISEIDFTTCETKSFYDFEVEMNNGDTLVANLSNLSDNNEGVYTLSAENGGNINPELALQGDTIVTHTVIANASDGGVVSGSDTVIQGEYATLIAIPDETHGFDGWYHGGTKVSDDWIYHSRVTEDIELNAVFIALSAEAVTVNFESGEGSGEMESMTWTTDMEYILPESDFTSPEGKVFKAWKLGDYEFSSGESVIVLEDITLTAVWRDAEQCLVSLNANGGEINSGNITSYTEGVGAMLPTDVTRNSHAFGGWYETEDFTGEAVTEISTTDTGDKTFYAKWTPTADIALGDIDGDGNVGLKDLSLLRRYLNGWDVETVPEAMDTDGDGSVTMKDYSLLRRYLNGWPVTLGANDAGLLGSAEKREPGEIAVGEALAKVGDTVTIPLTFKSNPGIVAYRLYVSYDKDALELLEGKAVDFKSVSFGPVESVPFNILWDESLNGNVTGAAAIAELTFRIKEGISGYSSVSVTYNSSDIYDRDLANVPFNVSNGGIEIVSSTGENRLRKVTVTGGSGSGEYGAGDSVTIHADPPPEGKVFDRWIGTNGIQFISGSQNSADAIFRMPDGDVALNATFRDQKLQGCYVATAVYGSYDCPEVWTLRRFRDNVLAKTWYGRLFIRLYYAVSPTAVRLFGDAQWFRDFWRERLNRMVTELQSEGFESTPYMDRDWN